MLSSLSLGQDLAHFRRRWRFQRIGWVILSLFIFAGVSGISGEGPLSKASFRDSQVPFQVEYPRLGRRQAPAEFVIRFDPVFVSGKKEIDFWLDRQFLEGVEIRKITPEPISTEFSGDRILYRFRAAEGAQGGVVTFHVEQMKAGIQRIRMGVKEMETLKLRQFVFP